MKKAKRRRKFIKDKAIINNLLIQEDNRLYLYQDYYDEKLIYPLRKKNQNFCKFNSKEVKEIIKLLRDTNLPQTEIAKQFNCDRKLIGQINSGKKYYIEGENYPIRMTAKRLSLQEG